MIAASVKDGDAVVHLLLSRGADVNQKSILLYIPFMISMQADPMSPFIDQNGQVGPYSQPRILACDKLLIPRVS